MANKKERVAMLSVVSNAVLVVFKLIIGLIIGSVSVISEAIHSGVDLVASVIAYFAVRTANKPPDEKHLYGHGKYENFSGSIEAILIFVAAGWIIFEAIKKLLHPEPLESVSWGVVIMIISALANIFVSNRLFKVGKATDSIALQADAWHLRTDVYTSFGVATGLLIYTIVGYILPQYKASIVWIDPVIAIAVALLIIKAAYELTVDSIGGLLDNSLPDEENKLIIGIIESFGTRFTSYHEYKTRKAGAERFIEFHIVVDENMTVATAHQLSDEIEAQINAKLPNCRILIHTDPYDDSADNKHVIKSS